MTPEIDGVVTIRSNHARFIEAFKRRVNAGLLTGQPHPRSNYQVVDAGPGELRVRAMDGWTAANVGLNDLELRCSTPGAVHYHVRYWRWARFALGLSAVLGLVGIVLLLFTDARGYIARNEGTMLPGLTVGQNLAFAWAMVVFWGFVWPWLLIASHKRPLRQLVVRIIGEVDAEAATK